MASAIFITDSEKIASETAAELVKQTELLSRKDIIQASLGEFGAIIICKDLHSAAEIANEAAPEHLEIMTVAPRELLPEIRNAGAVFLGSYSPEPLGDYMAGPSHVLPTSGTARFFSPLSVDSFLKKMSVIEYTENALRKVSDSVTVFANTESLTAHANSINIRFL
jgi:histidinol dehydrogenase